VGAKGTQEAGTATGSAYVFDRHLGGLDNWGESKKLSASDAAAEDSFGEAISISADVVAVGASGDDDFGSQSGSVYLYERDLGGGGNWGESKKVNAADQVDFDGFGKALAIDADRLLVGMWSDDEPEHKSGSAYIFERHSGGVDNWGEVNKLGASDAGEQDSFGWAVAIDADGAAVGAYLDTHEGVRSGSAYTFERNQGGLNSWGQTQKLVATDAAPGDAFGVSIGIGGETIVAGAPLDDHAGTQSGSVYVYAPVVNMPTLPGLGIATLSALLLVGGLSRLRARL
jgi:hypothetical protein